MDASKSLPAGWKLSLWLRRYALFSHQTKCVLREASSNLPYQGMSEAPRSVAVSLAG